MGEGVQVGKGGKSGETDERTLIEHYLRKPFTTQPLNRSLKSRPLDDVVNSTITSLLTLSRTNKRPAFVSIFLLNNISYLRTSLIVSPQADIVTSGNLRMHNYGENNDNRGARNNRLL